LRDGEKVLDKRENSSKWQMRYRLYDKEWRRVSTKHHNIDYAIRTAGDIYGEARFRECWGLSFTRRKFDAIAKICLQDIETEIDAGIKPMTNSDCIRATNKYLVPFFEN
jgi:hypothetical protein